MTRIAFFAYGCIAYLLFLATFLYAIAFVGGFAVASTLDGAANTPWPIALAVDIALLGAFAVQHSVMARRWFKTWWTQIVPWAIERSTYVLAASLALDVLFWQWRPLGGTVWTIANPALRVMVWTICAFGWLQVLATTFYINHFDLFGLRQVWVHLRGQHYFRVPFATPAPYQFVRHPLYLGFVLAFWAAPTMTAAHLLFAVATTAYIVLAIQLEERDLEYEHGPSYREYRSRVPMLLPIALRGPAPPTPDHHVLSGGAVP
jgi:protein-S-isoprenylcysteine O-methyltransferase Ste14